ITVIDTVPHTKFRRHSSDLPGMSASAEDIHLLFIMATRTQKAIIGIVAGLAVNPHRIHESTGAPIKGMVDPAAHRPVFTTGLIHFVFFTAQGQPTIDAGVGL